MKYVLCSIHALWSTLLCIGSSALFAGSTQYMVIVDAGSSSSKVHVYAYAPVLPMIPVPVIKDLFSQKSSPSLSSFVNTPTSAGASLQTILDAAVNQLQGMGVNDLSGIPIKVLATAGMRLLNQNQQNAIYDNVRSYIRSHYGFSLNDADVQTITGVMEGIYDWLDVNYLLNNFTQLSPTVGSIDMGGASTQIAFATTDTSLPNNEVSMTINHTQYRVFSQSFLGLGQDQALNAMRADGSADTCYPNGYSFGAGTGSFSLNTCTAVYDQVIQGYQVSSNILSTVGQKFVAFSGIYLDFSFFNVLQTPTQSALLTQIGSTCTQTWADLQTAFSSTPFLYNQCANGVYFNDLLYNTYQLQGSQLNVTNQLNGTSIDWALGALLYSLIQ